MELNKIQTEDAFTVEGDWIILPANQGKVSPEGVVYDANGEELYTLYEDGVIDPVSLYLSDGEEFDFVEKG